MHIYVSRPQSRRWRRAVAGREAPAEGTVHEGGLCRCLPPVSIRHRSSARPAAGNDDGFVEGLPIFLLADRIHRPKFRQQLVDQ